MKKSMSLERPVTKNSELFSLRFYSRLSITRFPGENQYHWTKHSCSFLLPHHCDAKGYRTTTKSCVVFLGSAKTTSGFFLKNCLMWIQTYLMTFLTPSFVLSTSISQFPQRMQNCTHKSRWKMEMKIFTETCGVLMTHNLWSLTVWWDVLTL